MLKILLTGGEGFFGTRFKKFYQHQYEILALDKNELDITNNADVDKAFQIFKPNYVIHAAAIALTDFCNKHPEIAYKVNVEGALNIANACKKYNSKLVFISTEQVFNGNLEAGPYNELHTANPDTMYGKNKLEAEKLIKEILTELWIVRFTWQFGISEHNCNMAANILWEVMTSLMKGDKIVASPNEYRGMGYINELIENFDKIWSLPYDTYHLGSPNDMSRYDVVEYILIEMGLKDRIPEVLIKDSERYKDHPRDARLDVSKAINHGLNFSSTRDALSKCIKEYSLKIK
ncbi:MAG: spore coat protein [Candidatus Epulonipiscium fishelsonii]|nr:MAG: spore coat protein [Epulopiscium sp. AS2M-Bin002]